MKQIRRGVALALATACAMVLTTTTAYAEEVVVNDGADATASLTDIRKVRVDHGDDQLTVRVNFPDLRKRSSAGLNVFIDKDTARRGPEFALGTPLFSGSDYALLRMRRWQPVGGAGRLRLRRGAEVEAGRAGLHARTGAASVTPTSCGSGCG